MWGRPQYVAAATLVFGLATGVALAAMMLVDALLFRPLPLVESDYVFTLHRHHREAGPSDGFTYQEYANIAENATDVLDTVSGAGDETLYVTAGAAGRFTPVRFVTERFFDVIGVRPVDGRGFTEADYVAGASPVALVTHGFWRSVLAGDRAAIGRTVSVGSGAAVIVGILPQGFRGLSVSEPVGIYLPIPTVLMLSPDVDALLGNVGYSPTLWIRITARLKAGVTARRAAASFTAVVNRNRPQELRDEEGIVPVSIARAALPPETRGDTLRFVAMLIVACGILLLAGCANVAGMMVVRNEQRHHEVMTRICLGAGRGRIVQLCAVEALVLTSTGALVGLQVALLLLQAAERFVVLPGGVAISDLGAGWTVYAMGVGVAATVVIAAAVCSSVASLHMAGGARLVKVPVSRWYRGILAGQVAVVVVLMVGAGLFVKSMRAGMEVDGGVNGEGLFYVTISFRDAVAEKTGVYRAIRERLIGLPGLERVTFGSLPLVRRPLSVREVVVDGRLRRMPETNVFVCGPDYLRTVGLHLLAGRSFRRGDESVAIVSESLARRFWGGGRRIGRRLGFRPLEGEVEVIGVVREASYGGVRDNGGFAVFLPWKEDQLRTAFGTIIGMAVGDAGALLPVVVREVRAVDPDLGIVEAATYEARIGELVQQQRVAASLLGVLGAFALLIAVLGVFSAVAHTVTNRMKEIAVGIALGANFIGVVRVGLSEAVILAGIGLGVGVCGAAAFAKMVEPYLLGVGPYDMSTYTTVVLGVLGVTVCAGVAPIVRAVRADSVNEVIRRAA